MREMFGELGSFIVELIAGSTAFIAIAVIWPMIKNAMEIIVLSLI